MLYISDADRKYIESKYHAQDGRFDPLDRFAKYHHGYEFDPSTGLDDAEMDAALERLYSETIGEDHALIKAMAFALVLDNERIDASENDYFFGLYNWSRPLSKHFISRWYDEVFDSMPNVKHLMKAYRKSGSAEMCLDTDHAVPYWIDILGLGFSGLLERSEEYRARHKKLTKKQECFFEAIRIEYEAILRFLDRAADYTEAHAGEKSEFVAKSLRNIKKGAPKNTFEALLTIYTYHLLSESVDNFQARSLGNGLDRSLYSYYKRDIESGNFTREQIKSFLAYFFLQYFAMGNYWSQPFYLCGTDFDEETDISELTLAILEVYDSLDIYNPKIQIKISPDTNPKIIYKALDMIRSGHNSIVLCCVPGMIKALSECYGVTETEARNADISGCNEMHVCGKETSMSNAYPNAAKAITYVFFDGIDTVTGDKIGLSTGDVCKFTSFDEFYSAFIKQFDNILQTVLDTTQKYEKYVSEVCPAVMLSATIESSLEKAIDAYGFGVKYPTTNVEICSFATAVDSLLAVKELVFEKKLTTLSELKNALAHNWEGYEDLRQRALRLTKKYGNGNPEADAYAAELFSHFSLFYTGKKNIRGGAYKVGIPSTRHFITQGKRTEATPDGRKMGEECSKNVQPVVGMEKNGVTAMIRSGLSLKPWLFSESFVLDVMLHPSAVSGDEGLEAMKSLLDTYMKNGGISIQFNVFSADMLRDAQKHHEKYQNLQVRISGWSVLWNNMSHEEQEAYIKRAESFE